MFNRAIERRQRPQCEILGCVCNRKDIATIRFILNTQPRESTPPSPEVTHLAPGTVIQPLAKGLTGRTAEAKVPHPK